MLSTSSQEVSSPARVDTVRLRGIVSQLVGGMGAPIMLPQQEAEEEKEVEGLLEQSSLVRVFLRLLMLQQRLQVVVVETEEKHYNLLNQNYL